MEPTPCKKRKTTGEEFLHDNDDDDTLAQIYCSGYVFYMSDGSRFRRTDVEQVTTVELPGFGTQRVLEARRRGRKNGAPRRSYTGNEDDDLFAFHMCEEVTPVAWQKSVLGVFNECGDAWKSLSRVQRDTLKQIRQRVAADRADGRNFTCAIIEGPGGCGKTRLIAHVMNHRRMDTLVLYVTKQNKRVQDFMHVDCLSGETDDSVQKPVDMTPMSSHEIEEIVRRGDSVGRFAVTAEKLVFAIAGGRKPSAFDRAATPASLGIEYDLFGRHDGEDGDGASHFVAGRNVVVLMDEYTMHQSPLIHALAYHVMRTSRSPLVLIMAGDRFQCGPVGWDDSSVEYNNNNNHGFTGDVRLDIETHMNYRPLDLRMDELQRCSGDEALSGCVRRLRRVCEEAATTTTNTMTGDRYKRNLLRLILVRYSVDAGVNLYVQERTPRDDGCPSPIRRVVPTDTHVLDFGGDENDEEYDENGRLEFRPCDDPQCEPAYDLSTLVNHFVTLYTTLAESTFHGHYGPYSDGWTDTVHRSVAAIRDLFPMFIVLSNNSCNEFSETFLLALYSQVRERVLRAPRPDGRVPPSSPSWYDHLERTLRRSVRRLPVDNATRVKRQTLFVGMVYKMTSTFKSDPYAEAGPCYLSNGETVVLTSIVYEDDEGDGSTSLARMSAVNLRKMQREADVDFTLPTGRYKNRMTENKRLDVMPFVPYVSENIFQMQGNTVPARARTFVDLVNAPCKSAYVAVSRFQTSESIGGIVISE